MKKYCLLFRLFYLYVIYSFIHCILLFSLFYSAFASGMLLFASSYIDVTLLTKETFDSNVLAADAGFWFVRFFAPVFYCYIV